MASEALLPVDLTPKRLGQFIQTKRLAGHHRLSQRRFKPLLDYIRVESAPAPAEPAETPALENLLAGYQRYLERERGLMPASVSNYVLRARVFLVEHADHGGTAADGMTAAEVT